MIREISFSDSVVWDNAVKRCKNYDVFYLWHYMKAFQLQGSGEPKLLVYENERDYAICAFFLRDIGEVERLSGKISKNTYYDISAPYGYGGFIGTVSDWNVLEKERNDWCVERGIVCAFERFNLFSEYAHHYSGNVLSRTHNVVRNLDMSIDEMWMDFKQKVRKNVKRAQKYNLEMIIDERGKYMEDFLRIYYSTMDRNDASDEFYFKKDFFDTLNNMEGNYCYFHVRYHDEEESIDKIISTELVIYGKENCYSYLGGTDKCYFDQRPNDFLKWEIIKWAKGKGLKNFVLGGGYGADDGIFEYKKCLAPSGIVDFYIGTHVFNNQTYNMLCEKAEINVEQEEFFPAYRAR